MADLAISTPTQWAHELERELGVAQSAGNTEVLTAWAAIEGGHWHNTAYGNVLGTTKREPGSTSINSVGVQRYTSWREGLAATVSMLRQSNMAGILASLKANASPTATAHAIGESPWVSGHTHNPAYESAIDRALGRNYDPGAAKSSPALPGAGPTSSAPAAQNASLLSLNPLTDLGNLFGLGGAAAGGLASGAANIAEGVTAPLIRWVDSWVVRAALVLLGTIALIVGVAGLFDGSEVFAGRSSSTSSDDDEGQEEGHEGEGHEESPRPSSSSRPRTSSRSKGAGGGVASDVETTAEGAAEAL